MAYTDDARQGANQNTSLPRPICREDLSDQDFNKLMAKGLLQSRTGEVYTLEEAFNKLEHKK